MIYNLSKHLFSIIYLDIHHIYINLLQLISCIAMPVFSILTI